MPTKFFNEQKSKRKNLNYKKTALEIATIKAYKATPVYTLDTLIAKEKKWIKRSLIAQNKALKIRKQINKFTYSLIEKENLK